MALLVASVTWIWDAAVGDEFCEQDSKAPDIGFDGEPARRKDSIKVYTTSIKVWVKSKIRRSKVY